MANLGDSIKNLGISELEKLIKSLNIQFLISGEPKPEDYLAAISKAVQDRLSSKKVAELKSLAKQLNVPLGSKAKKKEITDAIQPALTVDSLRTLLTQAPMLPELPDIPQKKTEGELEVIGSELVEIEKDVEMVMDKVEKIPAPDMADIYEIDKVLSEAIRLTIDYSAVGGMLDTGRVKFMEKRYIESLGMLTEAAKVSGDFFNKYQDIAFAHTILAAEKILEECREANSNDENAADALIDAKRAFKEKGVRRQDATKKLIEVADKVYREELRLLEELMSKREGIIQAMKIQGVDVFNAERYLHRARESYLIGELNSSVQYLDKAMNTANESKAVWVKEILDGVPRVEGIIKQAKELGANVADAEKHLHQAKGALMNKDYALCQELSRLAERKAMENQQVQIQKAAQLEREKLGDAQKIISAIEPLVQEAQMYRIEAQNVGMALYSARMSLQSGDYVNAMMHARQAEAMAKPLKTRVEAEREKIIAAGGDFKRCMMCNTNFVRVFDTGWARCMNCGQMFQVVGQDGQQRAGKKGWFGR
jgi:tetratricopeptide (TPR) repeat protein